MSWLRPLRWVFVRLTFFLERREPARFGRDLVDHFGEDQTS